MKALFIDRDGVILKNVRRKDGSAGSPRRLEEVSYCDNIRESLDKARDLGFLVLVITNQPDIARKKMTLVELDAMHDDLLKMLPAVTSIYVCPHDDSDECSCRKPKSGLLIQALKEHNLDLTSCWMIGDRTSDIEAATAVLSRAICVPSISTFEVPTRHCRSTIEHFEAEDVIDALRIISCN